MSSSPARPENPSAFGGLDPDQVLPWTVVRAGHAMARLFLERLAEIGLKPHLFGILVHLSREPGLSSAELARRVLVTPQSMGSLLRGLEQDGLVRRPGAGRRGQRLPTELTAEGRAALGRVWPVVADLNDPATLGLTAEESAQLNRLLLRVLAIHPPGTVTPRTGA
jgi:DNA-binding MarR family transcriptional regulator